MAQAKLPIDEVDFIAAYYAEMLGLELTPREMARMIGLLMHKLCKHEGRALSPEFLSNIFDKCQAAQMEHQIDKELEDGLLLSHLYELAEEKRSLNG